jgi:hypothetical protein
MYEGHIVPLEVSRQFPAPTQRRLAWAKLPPSSGKAKCVFGSGGL